MPSTNSVASGVPYLFGPADTSINVALNADFQSVGGFILANNPIYGLAQSNTAAQNQTALQNALNAAQPLGMPVYVAPGTYACDPVTVGSGSGIIGFQRSNGGSLSSATQPYGVTFNISNTSTPFITCSGFGFCLSGLRFYYPNQIAPTSSANPVVYPATIYIPQGFGDALVENLMFLNSYDGILYYGGRTTFQNLTIGALHTGIHVDQSEDWTFISDIINQVMWNVVAGLSWPQNIDTWVINNSVALQVGRADGLTLKNFAVFSRGQGIQLTDTSFGLTPSASYGHGVNIDIDTVSYGIVALSTDGRSNNVGGWKFTNLTIAPNDSGIGLAGQTGVFLPTGGNQTPDVQIANYTVRLPGSWASGPYTVQTGRLEFDGAYGLAQQGAIFAPVFPGNNVPFVNPYAFAVQLFFNGGTITGVSVNGSPLGTTSIDGIILRVGDIIEFTYTGSPGWTWWAL